MGKVISVANQKGGVAKSTTTLNLGVGLARNGKKVLLIDADRSGMKSRKMSFTDSMTGLFNRKYLTYYLEKNRKNYGKNRLLFLLLILTILKSITIITDMFKEILR